MLSLLKSTNRKLAAAIEKIESVAESNFPHEDSPDALKYIKGIFLALQEELKTQSENSDEVKRAFCRRAVEILDTYFPIIGFIARSADLDGPVEFHGPFSDLVCRALDSKVARLIMASEWEYAPFTVLFPELSEKGWVLVGLPACESSNVLLTPLAGHELGHNIWAHEELDKQIQASTKDAIVQTIIETQPEFIEASVRSNESRLRDFIGELQWYQSWQWLRRQCEEAFCDQIGLLIFRESFLHAAEYLLTPTLAGDRDCEYPSIPNRIVSLVKTCNSDKTNGITVPQGYESRFEPEKANSDEEQAAKIELTDMAFLKMIDTIHGHAQNFVDRKKLVSHDDKEIQEIERDFRLVVPSNRATSISNIVNAAWHIHLNAGDFLTNAYPGAKLEATALVLNELTLKSFEVFEINRRRKPP